MAHHDVFDVIILKQRISIIFIILQNAWEYIHAIFQNEIPADL